FDCEWDAPVTRAVKAAAARLSRLLGYGPPDLLPLPVATAAQGDGADVQPDELLEDGDAALDDGEEGELADATE
ncbi:MAG: hypothetical protein RIR00_993, partial [Pseudomonadota bacterium]